ncbi:GATAD2A [Cordylochernes scorpioides]|uniref:GATAD2A n=1 Tax=Cordylochernes scorpioides TaxID=51811 RepID=A0ABY6KQ14_9ARAC|nr:GATAD2A [Cordylochernes scorpioides]
MDLSVKKRKHPEDLSSKSSMPLDLNFSKKAKVQENHHHHHHSSKLLHNKKHSLPPPQIPLDLNNGHLNGGVVEPKKSVPPRELTEEERARHNKQIRKLKMELFNEEMKLMLLKKLQQSQMAKEVVVPEKSTRGTPPPPLVRASSKPPPAVPSSKQPPPAPRPNIPGPPPPLVLGNSSSARRSAHFQSPYNYHSLGESLRQTSGTPPDTQTPAQRQAAAKLALRKQLEKTLLQIPPPKPPPPEMHFLPNGNNQEFVYLLGLEWIVNMVVDESFGNQLPPSPFECSQCGTDFTPVWKWKDTGGSHKTPAVVCESCVTSNIKKALKAEHTNRLKTAFVKALQQEQEIEQRMATPPPALSPPTTPRFPKLTPAQQSFLHAQAMQLLPQPAHMLPTGPFPPPPLLAAAAAAYSYQMLASGGKQPTDLQRQYLLDMIPPPTSQSSASGGWKT